MAEDFTKNMPENEENDDLVELIDENGQHTMFEHLATLEYEGESYLALCDDEVADAVFAKLVEMTEDLDQD